ncbi:MAG: hypothetical protein R2699_18905 [Acidimicrobiales bacterium]
MIIRGGNNIHATDVEAALIAHPSVLEAAVIGVPHDVLGEDVAAFVVAAPGMAIVVDELLAHCAEHLADYKRPRRLVELDELPATRRARSSSASWRCTRRWRADKIARSRTGAHTTWHSTSSRARTSARRPW